MKSGAATGSLPLPDPGIAERGGIRVQAEKGSYSNLKEQPREPPWVWRFDGRLVLSRRDSTIVARHGVPGIVRKIVPSQRDD